MLLYMNTVLCYSRVFVYDLTIYVKVYPTKNQR